MPKRPSSNDIVKVLLDRNYCLVSQNGSHAKFGLAGRTVIVPMGYRQVTIGTFSSVIHQSGLSKKAFQGKSAK